MYDPSPRTIENRSQLTRADAVASIKRLYAPRYWEAAGLYFLGEWTRADNEMW